MSGGGVSGGGSRSWAHVFNGPSHPSSSIDFLVPSHMLYLGIDLEAMVPMGHRLKLLKLSVSLDKSSN